MSVEDKWRAMLVRTMARISTRQLIASLCPPTQEDIDSGLVWYISRELMRRQRPSWGALADDGDWILERRKRTDGTESYHLCYWVGNRESNWDNVDYDTVSRLITEGAKVRVMEMED